jgi:hypothetical protein
MPNARPSTNWPRRINSPARCDDECNAYGREEANGSIWRLEFGVGAHEDIDRRRSGTKRNSAIFLGGQFIQILRGVIIQVWSCIAPGKTRVFDECVNGRVTAFFTVA